MDRRTPAGQQLWAQAVLGEALLIIGTPATAIQLTQKEPHRGTWTVDK